MGRWACAGREDAGEERAGPGGAWPQVSVKEQNPGRGSGGSASPKGYTSLRWETPSLVGDKEQIGPRPTGNILASPPPNSPIIY